MLYIIVTTCINNNDGINDANHRKKLYIDCISNLLDLTKDMNVKIIIVENNNNKNTYLNDLGCEILYTNNNNIKNKHKGFKELQDIKQVINHYNIPDDNFIIKLTGRYTLLNNNFITFVLNCQNYFDAFIKFFNVCTLEYLHNDCVLGLFAVRCVFLKKYEYKNIRSPEVEWATYIRNNIYKERICEIRDLGLKCCFAEDHRELIV
jgi:hypothetical protein